MRGVARGAVAPPGILNINHFSNVCPPWNFPRLEKVLLVSALPPLKFVAYLGAVLYFTLPYSTPFCCVLPCTTLL